MCFGGGGGVTAGEADGHPSTVMLMSQLDTERGVLPPGVWVRGLLLGDAHCTATTGNPEMVVPSSAVAEDSFWFQSATQQDMPVLSLIRPAQAARVLRVP